MDIKDLLSNIKDEDIVLKDPLQEMWNNLLINHGCWDERLSEQVEIEELEVFLNDW